MTIMKRYLVALLALMPMVLAAQTAKVDTMVRVGYVSFTLRSDGDGARFRRACAYRQNILRL